MRKVSYRLPKDLRDRMRQAVMKTSGPKGKSGWVRQILADFLQSDPKLTRVGLGEALAENDVIDVVTLDDATWDLFEQACFTVRRQDPLFQGVQSAVIRAALRHALENDS